MNAAIYARKSTEQVGVNDEERSVARQVEHGRAYAARKGWTIAEDHIYVDDGISGAEFVKRPGLARLMNSMKPAPKFQILIMMEESRLGREQIETSYVLKTITDAGVRVFFYATDTERRLDNALDKVMLSLSNFASEMEREKASQRTHEAMMHKAKRGHVLNGKVYGYDNLDLWGEPDREGRRKRISVARRINPGEAEIVRRIFEHYSAGLGLKAIARLLTRDQVPAPRKGRLGWAPSALREILLREMYHGEIVWNKTQTIQRGGTRKQRDRPESEWIRLDAPELRIVSEGLWLRVQARFAEAKKAYLRTRDGQLLGRPAGSDFLSPYLASGLAQCSVCGGSIVGMTRGGGPNAKRIYICAYYHQRGLAVCTNNIRVSQEVLDSVLLHAINQQLDERIFEAAVKLALEKLRAEQQNFPDRQTAIERELSLIETRLQHLVDAIARGLATDSVIANLHSEEGRKKTLLRELEQLVSLQEITVFDAKRIAKDLHGRISDATSLLGRYTPQARQVLRKLLTGRIQCSPVEKDGVKGLAFTATGNYVRLIGQCSTGAEQVGPGGLPSTIPHFVRPGASSAIALFLAAPDKHLQ